MDVSSIASTGGALVNGGKIVKQGQQSELGMKDFFTLMAAQLQYQDPSSPTDTSQFMGQLAQFGMLEQMTNLSSAFTFSKASGIVGKNVEYDHYNDQTGKTEVGTGLVEAVDVSTSSPKCYINGSWRSMDDISKIMPASTGSTTTPPATSTTGTASSGTDSSSSSTGTASGTSDITSIAQELAYNSQSSALNSILASENDKNSSIF